MKNTVIILMFLIGLEALSQKQLQGMVVEEKINTPVFMARIQAGNQLVFTNQNGIFYLNWNEQCDSLFISHPEYQECVVLIEKNGPRVFTLSKVNLVKQNVVHDKITVHHPVSKLMVCDQSVESGAKTVSGITMPRMRHHIMPQPDYHKEEYTMKKEHGFVLTTREPLSTFSSDVDVASYSRVRRFINEGDLPPKDAVRIEEMINYFSYDYPNPKGGDAAGVKGEIGDCPWNKDHRILRIAVKAKDVNPETLLPSNFVFLVDVSGSMHSHDKLPLLQSSLKLFVKRLRPEDKIAMVTYAGSTDVVLESTSGSNKRKILEAVDKLRSGGSTAGAAGLQLAYKEAEKGFMKEGNNRIILATDGDFNVGPSSVDELIELVKRKRDSNVFMSVLGFGKGNLKDNRMEAIADNGNGNYSYIDNLQEAGKVLLKEFGSTMYVVAKDVKIQIEFNPHKVSAYRLIGYENRLLNAEDFNNDKKDAGDLGAGHTVTALYEIIPVGAPVLVDDLRYGSKEKKATGTMLDEWASVKMRYKLPKGSNSKLIQYLIQQENEDELSMDFKFAVSVAGFGMKLTNSNYGSLDYSEIANLAADGRGEDTEGYRAEFIRLVELAALLDNTASN